jgi:16S rRNA (guanine966-N2)-methyltransferase
MRDDGPVTRIVAGSAGGRRIAVPPRGTRPTAERVREALFSALESTIDLSTVAVLDLYAGSGALGLEALSRAAAHATFVEADRQAAHVLRRNAEALGFRNVRVARTKVETLLAQHADRSYQLVLADPPYDIGTERLRVVLESLVAHGWSEPDTLVVVERAVHSGDVPWPEALVALRTKRYGDTAVHWAVQEERQE